MFPKIVSHKWSDFKIKISGSFSLTKHDLRIILFYIPHNQNQNIALFRKYIEKSGLKRYFYVALSRSKLYLSFFQ